MAALSYLVDANILSYRLNRRADASELMRQLAPSGIAISAITYMETYQHAISSENSAVAQSRPDELLRDVVILDVTPEVARRCAELRASLLERGGRVRGRELDLIIAATALVHGLTLITYNTADFDDIPDLMLS